MSKVEEKTKVVLQSEAEEKAAKVDDVQKEKKAKKDKPKEERPGYNRGKMFYMGPGLLHTYFKAQKIMRKNKREPGTYDEQYRYEWAKKRVLKLLPLLDVEIQVGGIENGLDRGVVLMPNHESNFDVLALIAINDFSKQQPLAFIAKKELGEDKKMVRFMNLLDTIPLDRKSPRSAIEAFKQAKELVVDYKRSLVLFPEGTRGNSNTVATFLPASMKLPQMANAPIIPVSFIDSYKVFDKKLRKKSQTLVVKVVFGKPIMPQKHLQLSTEQLANLVQKEVQKGIDKNIDQELTPFIDLLKPEKAAKRKAKAEAKAKKKLQKQAKKTL